MVDGKDDVLQGNEEHRRSMNNQSYRIDESDAKLRCSTAAVPTLFTSQEIGPNEDLGGNSNAKIYDKEKTIGNRGRCGQDSHLRGFCSALPEALVLLSSDSEVEFCRCVTQSEQSAQNVLQMKSIDEINCTDCHFLSNHSDSDSESSAGTSSSEYVQPEEETNTETEEEKNLKRTCDRRSKNRKRTSTAPGQRQRAVKKQAIIMEAPEDHEVIPQRRSTEGRGEARTKRCTRGSQKLSGKKQAVAVERGKSSRLKSLDSKNTSKKDSGTMFTKKGKKKVSPAVLEAVFGNLQNCVANAEELSQKRKEDAMKCGRMTRTVRDGAKNTPVQQEIASPFEEGVPDQDENRDPTQEFPSCNPSIRTNQLSSDFRPTACRAGDEAIGQVRQEVKEHLVSDRSIHQGLQRSELNLHSQFRTAKATYRTGAADVVNESMQKDKSVAIEDQLLRLHSSPTGKLRSPSPVAYRDNRQYGRIDSREEGSPPERRRLPHQWSYDSVSGNPLSAKETPGSGARTFKDVEDRGRRHSKDSSSNLNCYGYRRSASPCGSMEREKERSSSQMNKSPSTSLLRGPNQSTQANFNALGFQIKEDVQILSLSDDRKRRRHKQSIRESQKIQRQSEGKKPFHLTVNNEGIPYGPGRPAWIGQINKLAKWLDPSCTDIRRQAHGDICIFKDRLNENFEYSGELNEDYLRGLMGKAVTRRRSDIISLINMGGSCPPQMDVKVWKRLELLAASKQREQRSEHGRFANSCRRTLGRTGASGEEGIRERLREMFGRSPDPDEVGHEMERDKGYGKFKEGMSLERSERCHEVPYEVIHNDNKRQQSRSIELRHRRSYDEDFRMQESPEKVSYQALKNKQASVGSDCQQTDWISEGRQLICGSEGQNATRKYSKDEQIARLEAELERLRGDQGQSSARSQEKSRGGWSPEKY